jgi:hypothetical protein
VSFSTARSTSRLAPSTSRLWGTLISISLVEGRKPLRRKRTSFLVIVIVPRRRCPSPAGKSPLWPRRPHRRNRQLSALDDLRRTIAALDDPVHSARCGNLHQRLGDHRRIQRADQTSDLFPVVEKDQSRPHLYPERPFQTTSLAIFDLDMGYERISGESRIQQWLRRASMSAPGSPKLNDRRSFKCIDLSACRFHLCVNAAHCHQVHFPSAPAALAGLAYAKSRSGRAAVTQTSDVSPDYRQRLRDGTTGSLSPQHSPFCSRSEVI